MQSIEKAKVINPLVYDGFQMKRFSENQHLTILNDLKMSAPEQGRQSPDPETQKGSQIDAPSNAHGVNEGSDNKEDSKKQLDVCL